MQELDRETIIQAARGDETAFETLYLKYADFVYRVAYGMLSNAEEAKEVTQLVFISLHRSLKYFSFKSALSTWIYRITINTAINQGKKLSRDRKRFVSYKDELISEVAAKDSYPGLADN